MRSKVKPHTNGPSHSRGIEGEHVKLDGDEFYRIANYDRMRPFFMSIVSASDHWMFISSTGALTAGRRDPDLALFPYYTDDKIHDCAEVTGSKTLIRIRRDGQSHLWEPFSIRDQGRYRTQRNLYKNFRGNKILFEEVNENLSLTFRYSWTSSDRFGFVRRAWLLNSGPATDVVLLDGIQNLIPCGIGSQFQLEKSTLADAYKKNELLPKSGLGLFLLSSIPIDRPEPAESLRATMAWSLGLKPRAILLSSLQLESFRSGNPLRTETDLRAERGAYFVESKQKLGRGDEMQWITVADVNRGAAEIAEIDRSLRSNVPLRKKILEDVDRGSTELDRMVASADGSQRTAHSLRDARHFSNVLFNIMRGGLFHEPVPATDLRAFVHGANRQVAARNARFFRGLKSSIHPPEVVVRASKSDDPQLERLCREYLPLTFSRRHGDPSRPWNRFCIVTHGPEGDRVLDYAGNWRDIFQNWEALAHAFPPYTAGMVCKFVNASTADGYNPYRITRNGVDWEVSDPHDPWSFIGYWGDHQIIYLLKLLEVLQQQEPTALAALLDRKIFSHANVPYRIKDYAALLANPKETVEFDQEIEALVAERVRQCGSDGKLIWDDQNQVHLSTLAEKLLIPVLTKLTNFIPEAGIWLNTQRPEWNDANNALVGNGVSVVTLCYLRRHLAFLINLFLGQSGRSFPISSEVAKLFHEVHRSLKRHRPLLDDKLSDTDRKQILDALGRAGSNYRRKIYDRGFSGRDARISSATLIQFLRLALEWVDHSIAANRRSDGLYHAYNLVAFENDKRISIRRLPEMLEGQVAALSSGLLSFKESLEVLQTLRQSRLYRADQSSYLLYPDRQLKRFMEKNNLPPAEFRRSALLRRLVADGNRQLVERDVTGKIHFNSSIRNAHDVRQILAGFAGSGYARLARRESALVLEMFERLFDHHSFTGRSGTFFGYEGLGCIYWHMVSKLLLAAQETCFRAASAGAPENLVKNLAACYYDIRAGIGDCKTPEVYGAFPMDPYSHTPGQGGARQPGLTGQVKEDILCRMGELGILVENREIRFCPSLLRSDEFVTEPTDFTYFDIAGVRRRMRLKAGMLAFTFCQVPIVYRLAKVKSLTVFLMDGRKMKSKELQLDSVMSGLVFNRTDRIKRIEVDLD